MPEIHTNATFTAENSPRLLNELEIYEFTNKHLKTVTSLWSINLLEGVNMALFFFTETEMYLPVLPFYKTTQKT